MQPELAFFIFGALTRNNLYRFMIYNKCVFRNIFHRGFFAFLLAFYPFSAPTSNNYFDSIYMD